MSEIPKWVKSYLDSKSAQMISDSVAEAEKTTSGEIVPMIVHRSATVGHVPVIVLLMFVIAYLVLDAPNVQEEMFGPEWMWLIYLSNITLLLVISSAISRLHFVQRHLTSRADLEDQVDMRSELEFFESGIKNTRDSTGILLFVSLMEHRAVVLADKAIKDKMPPDTWEEVCSLLIAGIKAGDMAKAYKDAIEKSGEILSKNFPIKHDDTNELKNHLIIKE